MNSKVQKVLNICTKVIAGILVAFTVFMMIFTIVSVSTVNKNDRRGLKFYIVRTDSMSPSENNEHMDVHFDAGDIIIVKNVKDKTALQPDQIISFISANEESYGETVTHMIRSVKTNDKGEVIGYVTYGTNKGVNDEALVQPEFVLGEYAGKFPKVGYFFAFVKSTPGYILCILVPFLLLIMYNGVNVIRLFRKYKKEQTAIMDAEKAEIAAERKQTEDMLRELQALKAQLAQQTGGIPTAPAGAPEAPLQDTTNTSGTSEEASSGSEE